MLFCSPGDVDGGVDNTVTSVAAWGGDDTDVLLGITILSGRRAAGDSCFTGVTGTTCGCGRGGCGCGRACGTDVTGFCAIDCGAGTGARLGTMGAEQRGCFLGR